MSETATLDESSRLRLANEIMALFEYWQVNMDDQISLLGLSGEIRKRQLRKFRQDTPLPDDQDVMARAEHLVGISDALRTYFPNSTYARSRWMRTTSKKFPRNTPIQIMLRDGMSGLIRVRAHLDCTYAWDISGSRG